MGGFNGNRIHRSGHPGHRGVVGNQAGPDIGLDAHPVADRRRRDQLHDKTALPGSE